MRHPGAVTEELAVHVRELRRQNPRSYHVESMATLVRWLLIAGRPTAADLLRAGMDAEQVDRIVDARRAHDDHLLGDDSAWISTRRDWEPPSPPPDAVNEFLRRVEEAE